MAHEATDDTLFIHAFPSCYTSERYMSALEKATDFRKTHTEEQELPEEIIAEAIGPRPPYCDSLDTNAMSETIEKFKVYRKNLSLFMHRVAVGSR